MKIIRSIYTCTLLWVACTVAGQNSFSVFNLTCEQEENPLGIETLRPRFSWQIQAQERDFEQGAWQLLVADSEEILDANKGNIWDSGKRNSSSSILNPFDDAGSDSRTKDFGLGSAGFEDRAKDTWSGSSGLKAGKRYFWKVRIWDKEGNVSPWSGTSYFQMGLLTEKDWQPARWIALEKDRPDEFVPIGIHGSAAKYFIESKKFGTYQLPQFRRVFRVREGVKNATAYISGLGHFDLFLNGEKVGDQFLDPGWTKYDKCALYVSFDITDLLQQGDNALGVMLGNGFYNTPGDRYLKMLTSYGAPKMRLNLQIEYSDGSTQQIVSDDSWKVTESPVTFSSIYGGEDYDATKEQTGWKQVGFFDKTWKKPVLSDYQPVLASQRATPLKIRNRLPALRISQTEKGEWVYDLGQNASGIVALKVKGAKGQAVKLHPAELLNPDGSINQSASGSPFYFTYTLKGEDVEAWQPQFTYYGFRYVQLEGAVPAGQPNPENLPEVIDITGLHTCNAAAEVGTFSCSNEMFNQIYRLIDWSMRSNMASVITDCPHREKLGWLEVAHLMQYSFQYRYQMARLYGKKTADMRSTQAGNGQIPTTAPELVEFAGGFKDTPEWGSAFIICPWYTYLWYGDKSLMEEYYPDMQRYLDYLGTKANQHIIAYGLGDWYDIGPKHPGESQLTSNGVTATAIYYYNTTILQKMATLLGKPDDAARYGQLATQIKEAFNATFWDETTQKYDRNSQAANAVALYMGLTTEKNREQTFQNLVADIRSRNNALTAGDVGYRYVLRALEANDASDIIYDMNCKYDVPGYGWQLAHGATSLTESWQAYGFVSNNHCMLGHLMEWLFSGLGGIRLSENAVAFKDFVIKPEIVGDIHTTTVTHQSPYGIIQSAWQDDEKTFTLRVEIPANSSASVYLPASDIRQITESGQPLKEANGIQVINDQSEAINTPNRIVVKIGSGIYNFKVKK